MQNTIISIKGLTYKYPQTHQKALDNINLDIDAGEFVALLGANGSGKSTLAKHLNGLLKPTAGKVLVDGLDTGDESVIWQIREKVGMVFQNPDNQLVTALVEEELAFGPENLGLPPEEIRQRVNYVTKRLQLESFLSSSPHLLSGGQKQRVAIAAVLALQPEVLVLDEPTSMLDPVGRQEVLTEVLRLKEQGKTVVLITHDMAEAALADRIVVLNRGRVDMAATPRQCFARTSHLQEIGLEVPMAAQLSLRLELKGLTVPRVMLGVEDWVAYLCEK